ncbi:MAG: CoA-binding protein [Chloroflexi bacterium]|nr:CoA-binding protein [Chloroflexota bacterium]
MTSRTDHVLRQFFEPRGVVVVGSLREGRGEGWTAIDNMQRLGYKGGIFPVNPGYAQVLGRKAYPSIDAVMEPFDLAVIITPPPTVVGMIEQCARKGVKAIIVSTEGFAESGEAGAVMQRQLLDTARGLGVRIIGPNTLGIVNTANGLVTNPYPLPYNTIHRGGIAFSSQSGIIGAHAQPMEDRVYHVGKMCDFGNKSDIDESDWLEYLTYDPLTSVISIHLETVKDGARLLDSLRKAVARKPVLVLKTGRTEAGARASASHTGSLAQDQRAINELIKQAGALPLGTWQEFWEVPKVFDSQPLPRGNRIAVVTLTGGVGVTATDVAM